MDGLKKTCREERAEIDSNGSTAAPDALSPLSSGHQFIPHSVSVEVKNGDKGDMRETHQHACGESKGQSASSAHVVDFTAGLKTVVETVPSKSAEAARLADAKKSQEQKDRPCYRKCFTCGKKLTKHNNVVKAFLPGIGDYIQCETCRATGKTPEAPDKKVRWVETDPVRTRSLMDF
jgi:predicted RNA-binding Zn-ribbon protein involved in translation (DUF1610 family)